MIQFPKDFLWGAATSAHQVEGNNIHNDWWEWEKRVGLKETSGEACRHYELYKEDFDLARQLSHNAHRFSIEWSRIEPEQGKFQQEELNHYRDVVISLRQRNIEPIVTLHHFTNPIWFAHLGGWVNKRGVDYFLRYVALVVTYLADKARYWVTINEPLVYTYHAYLLGAWPPQEKSFSKARKVSENLIAAHIKAYELIHRIYGEKKLEAPLVSIAKNTQYFDPCSHTLKNRIAVTLRNHAFNFSFIDRLIKQRSLDYLGINYYTRSLVDVAQWGYRHLLIDTCRKNHSQLRKNSLGWDIFPEGLLRLLLALRKYHLPVFILENGISTDDDSLRWNFIQEHLKCLHTALGGGVNILGYLYWSLLDNYEWDKGFGHRFGLIEVDYRTYQRTIRESSRKYAQVCKNSALD